MPRVFDAGADAALRYQLMLMPDVAA